MKYEQKALKKALLLIIFTFGAKEAYKGLQKPASTGSESIAQLKSQHSPRVRVNRGVGDVSDDAGNAGLELDVSINTREGHSKTTFGLICGSKFFFWSLELF